MNSYRRSQAAALSLSCPLPWTRQLLRSVLRQPMANVPVAALAHVTHVDGSEELLVNSVDAKVVLESDVALQVILIEELPGHFTEPAPGRAVIWVARRGGQWHGLYRRADALGLRWPATALDELRLPGPGLQVLFPHHPPAPEKPRPVPRIGSRLGWWLAAQAGRSWQGRFSRTAGALGWPALESLRQKRYGVIGAGRNGTAVAMLLACLEPYSIILIDPDVVRDENLDGMPQVARPPQSASAAPYKAAALAASISARSASTAVYSLTCSVVDRQAIAALAECDVVITACDDDVARLTASAVATANHRVLLDLGSHVLGTAGQPRHFGADCRLVLPGDRDLACFGGFAQDERLERFAHHEPPPQITNWRENKAGALTSWSTLVAGLGFRMLEDLASGRITRSTWFRIEQPWDSSVPRILELTADRDPYCPICSIAGRGSAAIAALEDLAAGARIRARRHGE